MNHSRLPLSDAPTPNPSAHGSKPPDLTHSILTRLRSGDPDAGRLLDLTYRPAMLRFCLGYLHDPMESEDAVQEIFWRVLRSDALPDNFRPWLYKVARNHCIAVLRERKRHHADRNPLPTESIPLDESGNLTRLVRAEAQHHLADLLAQLSPEENELLRLRYTEGLSRKELADVMDEPESVIKSRLFEAIEKLRKLAGG